MSILVLLRLILFIYIEHIERILFCTDLFILQLLLYLKCLGNLYIHVKCNAPLNGFIPRYMA